MYSILLGNTISVVKEQLAEAVENQLKDIPVTLSDMESQLPEDKQQALVQQRRFNSDQGDMLRAAYQRVLALMADLASGDDLVSINITGGISQVNGRLSVHEHFYVGVQPRV